MKDLNRICFSCMEDNGGQILCPHCGFNNSAYEAPLHHLRPGSILNGKYIIGKVIGEGGFGITYVGWDANLDLKVAVKEYFPNGFVSRDVTNTDTITVFTNADPDFFLKGRERFLDEAKTIAKFDNVPGIVSVKDFFIENGTAYIVMEYVEGDTLKDYLDKNGGRLPADKVFDMMKPLMASLAQVHKKGLIHRDISPDNIKLTGNSQMKLLDFGAARDISEEGQKSLSIQLKPGYAPEEQYRSHGKQGPWTDVYALCGTMYRAITGSAPVEALERIQGDTLMPPSRMGIKISPVQERALMHGLAVFASQRLQSIDQLYDALYNGVSVPQDNTYGGQKQVYNRTQRFDGGFSNVPVNPVNNGYNNGGYNVGYQNASIQQEQKPKSRTGILIGAGCAAGAVIIALIIIAVLFVSGQGSGKNSRSDSGGNSHGISDNAAVQRTPEPATPEPTDIPAPVFTIAQASSIRGTDTQGGTYSVESVLSQDNMTKWVPAKSSGNGVGEWIQVSSASVQYIRGIYILNGYHKNSETWSKNNRVSSCTITFSSGESRSFVLNDTMDLIMLDLGGIVATSSIKLTINGVYKGSAWNDTAITYLGAY